MIRYAFLDAEYRNRASVEQILLAVKRLQEPERAQTPEIVMRTYWSEIWNPPYNLALLESLVAPDLERSSPWRKATGLKHFQNEIQEILTATTDLRLEIDKMRVS